MRATLALVVVLGTIYPSMPVNACGDKFLMIGRNARFNQVYAAIYPATILLYVRAARPAPLALLDTKFAASLARAGHRVAVVNDARQAVEMLGAGRFDLVLADAADTDALRVEAERSPSRPAVIALVVNPTKAESEALKARQQYELRPLDRPARYLSAIDEAMQARVKQRAARKDS